MSEMAEDMLDGLLEDSDEEVEADDVMAQVFDEIGLDLNANLVAAPSKSVKTTGSGLRTRTGAAAARIEEDSSAPPLSAAEEAEADRLLAELAGV
jgi:charged multivesicular body protein 2A